MSTALNYQFSIFGNYSIPLNPEIITELMTVINKSTSENFLPNVISSQQVDIPMNRVTPVSNLGFVSQDQKFNIAILNGRIDFNGAAGLEIEIDKFYDLAVKALEAIMKSLNLSSNRLAINMQMVYELPNCEKMMTMGKSIIKSPKYYNEKPFFEWSTMINTQTPLKILDNDEIINTIVNLSTARSVQEERAAILYHIDINTSQQNLNMRFDHSVLSSFVKNAIPISKEIETDVERMVTAIEQ